MGKILKIREVGDPVLEKECDKVEIKNINGNKIIRFGARMGEYINFYIANLINSILNINLKYDIQTKTIYSELPYISQQRTYGSLKEYISCLLYLGIIILQNKSI